MSTTVTTITRIVCDECGADIDDPTEGDLGTEGCDTEAWLRHLATEDGWVLDHPRYGDLCEVCVAENLTEGE